METLKMARPGVTYFDVSNAANQLIAAGKAPTIETVRQLLGTGSNSTLGTHLRTWKAKQEHSQHIATKENLPEELVAALKGVWDRVMDQSEEKIQSIEQEAQQDLAKLNQEIESLRKDNTHWQQQYQQTKQERDGLISENSAIEQLLNNAKIEISVLTEKQASAELQNKEKQVRINELHQQNQQIQANLEHYRAASLDQRLNEQQRYEQQQKQLEQTIQHISQELAQTQKEKMVLQQKTQQFDFEKDSVNIQLNKLSKQHESVTTRLTDALSEIALKKQEYRHWQTQYNAMKAKYDEQNKALLELQTLYAVLSQQFETLKNELKVREEQNKLLAHEKWMLGQEKAQLHGQLIQLESCMVSSQ